MKILISGEGGLGVQIIAEVLAKVSHNMGKFTSYIPNFGVEQRGGASVAFLQISDKKVIYPKFSKADIIIVMSNRSVPATKKYIGPESLFIFDSSNIDNEHLNLIRNEVKKTLNIKAREWALKNLSTKVTNMIFLGALLKYLPEIKLDDVKKALSEKLADSKNASLLESDFKAIEYGIKASEEDNTSLNGLEKQEVKNVWEDEKKTWQRHPELCKGCGLCVVRCPVNALKFSNDLNYLGSPIPEVDINKCISCELCQKTCPEGALKISKKE